MEQTDAAEAILTALHHVSVPVPTWHLTALERWLLFRDLLFGNVRIRGSVRPRDLPLDATCMQVLSAASSVQAMRPYRDEHGNIFFRHWLLGFCLLNSVAMPKTPKPKLSESEQLACVILELVIALIGEVPDANTPLEAIAKHSFTQRLIGVLGLSQQEWNSLWKQCEKDPSKRSISLARFAALVAALPAPPQSLTKDPQQWQEELAAMICQDGFTPIHNQKKRSLLKSLDEHSCRRATLKIPGVQRYIAQGKNHWNFRGASAWCSQTLGVARECFLDVSKGLLTSDSDAIVAAWLTDDADEQSLNDAVTASIGQIWGLTPKAGVSMHARFPRLAEWLSQEIEALRAVDPGISPLDGDTQLPAFSVRCRERWSVLQVCVNRVAKEKKQREAPEIPTPAVDKSTECAHVMGHPPVFSKFPPWLIADGKQRVGIAAVAWSLCGTTYRTHSHEGLCEALGDRQLQLQSVHHGEWLEALGMPDSQLTHLKLDGDEVGNRFTDHSLADATWLSIELARLMQCRLLAGVRKTLVEHRRSHPDLPSRPLPVDVVYLGGDDLYVCLPWDLVEVFLSGFGGEDVARNPWNALSFTFIAARLQPKGKLLADLSPKDWAAREARLDAANQTAARLLTYGLRPVKDSLREGTPLDTSALQALADRQRMKVHADGGVHNHHRVRGRVIDVMID